MCLSIYYLQIQLCRTPFEAASVENALHFPNSIRLVYAGSASLGMRIDHTGARYGSRDAVAHFGVYLKHTNHDLSWISG